MYIGTCYTAVYLQASIMCLRLLRLGEAKDARGKRLIQFFSVPRKPTKTNPKTRNMPEDAPEKWAEYINITAKT